MEIIPVLDLKAGVVVRASGGVRSAYKPISTPLAPSSDPLAVLAGIRQAVDARTAYIADLDAIERQGSHHESIAHLRHAFPDMSFWIDAGVDAVDATRWLSDSPFTLVIGSESQPAAEPLRHLRDHPRVVLSLDFRDGFIGPREILDDSSFWPGRVIVMTLGRVGSGGGPDFDRLHSVRAHAQSAALYAAGGVRSIEDIRALQAEGIAGALISTSLHNGAINRAKLRAGDRGRPGPATA